MEIIKDLVLPIVTGVASSAILGVATLFVQRLMRGTAVEVKGSTEPVNSARSKKQNAEGTRDQPVLAWSLESNRATPKVPPTAQWLLVAVCFYFLLGVSVYWGFFRTSSASERRPLDPRIVGTWTVQGTAEWNGTYHGRTLVFSPNGHYVFSASREKDGGTDSEAYSGDFYFLDGDVIEFTGGGVVKMSVGWLSDDEIILAGASGSLLHNREKETLFTGKLKRVK